MKNRFIANWGRLILAMAMVIGFGWLSPIGSDGAGATPQYADHGHHGHKPFDRDDHHHHGHKPFDRDDHHRRVYEMTGRVIAIVSSNEFTLTAKGHLAFKVHVSDSTKYVEPGVPKGTAVGLNDLAVGDMVQVRGARTGDRDIDAVVVRLPVARVVGTVQAVTSSEITLSPGRSELTSTSATIAVDISAGTVFKDPGVSNPSIADVLPGDVVQVFGAQKAAIPGHQGARQIDATVVVVPLVSYVGAISSISVNGFSLAADGLTVSVSVSAATKYEISGVAAPTLSSLADGDIVRVIGSQAGKDAVDAILVRSVSEDHLRIGLHGSVGDNGHGHYKPRPLMNLQPSA